MICSNEALAPWLEKIEACPVIGLDTEADSLYSYPERLCLIQLALPGTLLLVDPLSEVNLEPLWQCMKGAEVVIHASAYDLRLLARHYDFVPGRLFDTMWAARLLGFREFGLQHLVRHFHDVQLKKGSQKADWGKRPLKDKMTEYALNDVRYLLSLYEVLKRRLEEVDRLDWLHELAVRLGEEAVRSVSSPSDDAWRIKGSSRLNRKALACLQALWWWREKEACGANKPPYFVLSHQLLLQVATLAVERKNWEACLPLRFSSRRRREIRGCLRRVSALPANEWPEKKRSQQVVVAKAEKNRIEELKLRRDTKADTLGLDPALIASKATLVGLARDWENQAARLMGWQRKLIEG
ncbi:MAG: Ribonuclease D [Verrucomicrobia subdivision 3 bacterium]|nr:Ribonuclease D [Limisphaerales bacterium]MCS1415307.1 Ribonuclease D [Limisphaerales bacterium]